MNGRIVAALSAAGCLAFASGAALTHAARADASPDVTCNKTTPCLAESNSNTGAGIKGSSTKGSGVIGTTNAASAQFGVLGQDLRTTGGFGNAGVRATTTNGIGVWATSVNSTGVIAQSTGGDALSATTTSGDGVRASTKSGIALSATSTSGIGVSATSKNGTGVRATSTNGDALIATSANSTGISAAGLAGIVGEGSTAGVTGLISGTGSGDSVLANSFDASGNLFRGNNASHVNVFVVDNGGNATIGGVANVTSNVTAGGIVTGQSGVVGVGGTGVIGQGFDGVEGISSSGIDDVFASSLGTTPNMFRGNNSAGVDEFIVQDSGDVFAHAFHSTLTMSVIQPTATGQKVNTYAQQASQPSLEDFGEAQLVNGVANVRLDPKFVAAIDRSANYLVVVTPEGDSRGVYVTQKTGSGFVVRENQGGRSSVPFSYRIIAKPFGSPAARLEPATGVALTFETIRHPKALPTITKLPPLKHQATPVLHGGVK